MRTAPGNFNDPVQIRKALDAFRKHSSIGTEQAAQVEELLVRLAECLDSNPKGLRCTEPVLWAMAFMCHLKIREWRMYEDIGSERGAIRNQAIDWFIIEFGTGIEADEFPLVVWLAMAMFMGMFAGKPPNKRRALRKACPGIYTDYPILGPALAKQLSAYPKDEWEFPQMPGRYYDSMLCRIYQELESMSQI